MVESFEKKKDYVMKFCVEFEHDLNQLKNKYRNKNKQKHNGNRKN